jgi:chlorite dismutase
MHLLNADHYCFFNYNDIKPNYDFIFMIIPKNENVLNKIFAFFNDSIIEKLKQKSKYVLFVQEGPSNYFQDFNIYNQIKFY